MSRTLMQVDAIWLLAAGVLSFLLATTTVDRLARHLYRSGTLADANARSMHEVPTPIGGGWGIVPLVALALIPFFLHTREPQPLAVAAGMAFLAVLSWADDRHDLPRSIRLAAQALAVACVLALPPSQLVVFSEQWPLWADRLLTGLCWLWFINLFNFMDGIDGLAGTETLFVAFGLLLIGLWEGHDLPRLLPLAVLAGAVAGFLRHNWPPAKIFLGDVGAIPLGFLLGWLLIRLAGEGHLAAALLLPGYFVADASITLLRRLLAGEAIWQAHRSHFYQRAVLALGGHAPVVWRIIVINTGLLILALLSLRWPWSAFAGGIVLLAVALITLHRTARDGKE